MCKEFTLSNALVPIFYSLASSISIVDTAKVFRAYQPSWKQCPVVLQLADIYSEIKKFVLEVVFDGHLILTLLAAAKMFFVIWHRTRYLHVADSPVAACQDTSPHQSSEPLVVATSHA